MLCLGAPLARAVLASALTLLLTRYRPTPAWTAPIEPIGTTLQPNGGLPVALDRVR